MAAAQQPEMEQPGTAVAPVEKNKVLRFLDSPEAKARILPMLGNNGRFDQVKVEVWAAMKQNPEIAECTPESMVLAISQAVGTGLIIGKGVHLVPFNVKVSKRGEADRWEKRLQAILDYKGKIELIVRTGAARSIDAKCVYENDVFEYEEGLVQKLRHVPVTNPSERGQMVGAWAIARIRYNVDKTMFVPIDEIEAIRAKSKQWAPKKLPSGTVINEECPYWYALKTVIHRLAKELPSTPRLALALRQLTALDDDELGSVEDHGTGALPAGEEPPITYSLPPRGTPLRSTEAYDDRGARDTTEVQTVVSPPRSAAPPIAAAYANAPSPYGDDAPPHPAEMEDADFSFDDEAAPPQPSTAPAPPPEQAFRMPFGPRKDEPLGEIDSKTLVGAVRWAEKQDAYPEFRAAAAAVLNARG